MTYNVFGGTLSLTQSINQSLKSTYFIGYDCLQLRIITVGLYSADTYM